MVVTSFAAYGDGFGTYGDFYGGGYGYDLPYSPSVNGYARAFNYGVGAPGEAEMGYMGGMQGTTTPSEAAPPVPANPASPAAPSPTTPPAAAPVTPDMVTPDTGAPPAAPKPAVPNPPKPNTGASAPWFDSNRQASAQAGHRQIGMARLFFSRLLAYSGVVQA